MRCELWAGAYIIRVGCTLSCLSSREILWALSMETQKWNFLLLITFYFWTPNGAEQTKQFRQDKGRNSPFANRISCHLITPFDSIHSRIHHIWVYFWIFLWVLCFIQWPAFRLLSPQQHVSWMLSRCSEINFPVLALSDFSRDFVCLSIWQTLDTQHAPKIQPKIS